MNIGLANEIHHFGYATRNIQETEKLFQTLGFIAESELIHDELLGVSVKFYKASKSETRIEIVAPIDNVDNPISSSLTKRPGQYHIAFSRKIFLKPRRHLI